MIVCLVPDEDELTKIVLELNQFPGNGDGYANENPMIEVTS